MDAVAKAEAAWRAAWRQRAALVMALSDHGRLLSRIGASKEGDGQPKYVLHADLASVRNATDVAAADDDEEA